MDDDTLHRLLRAAARATPPLEDPACGLEGRILASWRSGGGGGSFDPFTVLRPVLMGALALVCVVGALEYKSLTESADPATVVTNSAFQVALN